MSEKNDVFVIAPTEGGFRVYSPANITRLFMVSGIPDSPQCNCADFEAKSDPEWRCKHILAVLNQREKREPPGPKVETQETQQPPSEGVQKASEPAEKKKTKTLRNGQQAFMAVKRSVSPDGKINSLSVKFLNPIDGFADEEIKRRAEQALKLQEEIVSEFLRQNRGGRPNGQANAGNVNARSQTNPGPPTGSSDGVVPAQLLNIAGMNTRGGWKTFINVQVNGTTTKVFGNKRELGEMITAAGFASIAEHISQGMMLNLPCRVITKPTPDGRYLNIERVLPLKPLEPNGRAGK
jgi:hypothetical protein